MLDVKSLDVKSFMLTIHAYDLPHFLETGDNLKLDEGIVLPLDHDNSQKPDSGYTGWTEYGAKIFVTNYITSEMAMPYISGYLIEENDFIRGICSMDL